MKTTKHKLLIMAFAMSLAGCATEGYPPPFYANHQKAIAGTAMGAAGGALLGGAITQSGDGALVGGLLGGAAGGLVGHSMDRNQRPQPYYSGNYYQGGYQPYYPPGRRRGQHRHDDDD